MGIIDSPLFRKCGEEEEISSHVLCLSEALDSTRHTYLGSFFLDPDYVGCLTLGVARTFSKVTGLPWLGHQIMGHEGPVKKGLRATEPKGLEPIYYSILEQGEKGYSSAKRRGSNRRMEKIS
jgi:hypothetical protein